MPADQIIVAGDAHVEYAVRTLFTNMGGNQFGYVMGKLIIVIVVISVLGTTNSFAMGASRYIQALAEQGYFFKPKKFRKMSDKYKTPTAAATLQLILTMILLVIYYLQEAHGLFLGIVIDELPVAFETIFFVPLMLATFLVWRRDKSIGILKGLIAPFIRAIGQVFILIAFFTNNGQAVLYFVVCIVVIIIGLAFKYYIFDKYRQSDEFKNREVQVIASF
jgi:amino acid transporter